MVVFIDELGVMAKQMEQPASTGGPEVFIVLFQTQTELSFISFFGKVLQQRSSAPARLLHEQRSVTGEAACLLTRRNMTCVCFLLRQADMSLAPSRFGFFSAASYFEAKARSAAR